MTASTKGTLEILSLNKIIQRAGAKTADEKLAVQGMVETAVSSTGLPFLNMLPSGWIGKIGSALTGAGYMYQKGVTETLLRMFNDKFSNPKVWQSIGNPLLGKKMKTIVSDARKKFIQTEGKLFWEAFAQSRQLRKSKYTDLLKAQSELKSLQNAPGFINANQLTRLNDDVVRLKSEFDTANASMRGFWTDFKEAFYSSKIYNKQVGPSIAYHLGNTKVADAYADDLVNRLIAYLRPNYGQTIGGSIAGLGKSSLRDLGNLRKSVDILYNEAANLNYQLNQVSNGQVKMYFDVSAAQESLFYTMMITNGNKFPKAKGPGAEYINLVIDLLNSVIGKKQQEFKDKITTTNRLNIDSPGSEEDLDY